MVSPTKKYTKQGQYGTKEEPYTTPNLEGTPSSAPEPPGPMPEEGAALDARIRLKQERDWVGPEADTGTGDLTDEEGAFLANLPADSAIPPERFQAPRKPVPDAGRSADEQIDPSSLEHSTRPFATNVVPKKDQPEES